MMWILIASEIVWWPLLLHMRMYSAVSLFDCCWFLSSFVCCVERVTFRAQTVDNVTAWNLIRVLCSASIVCRVILTVSCYYCFLSYGYCRASRVCHVLLKKFCEHLNQIACSFVLFDLFVCPHSFAFPWTVESSPWQFLVLA